MTRAVKARKQRRVEAPPPPPKHSLWLERAFFGLVAVAVVFVAAVVWRVSAGDETTSASEAGPVHVHGLGVDPTDGALYIATHTGLFRSGPGESKSERVGDSAQDTMGFTVVGENRFLGSGHPDLRSDLPPLLGLIESTDSGRSWKPISLLGEADFHVLRSAGERVYGYDVTGDRLLVSDDAGRTWRDAQRPAPLVDLVVNPADADHVIAAAASDLSSGLFESRNGGQSWTRIADGVGLLAWPSADRLHLVDGAGDVFLRSGGTFERRGNIGGQPAALLGRQDELFVALHDGTVKRSADRGATWTVRSTP